MFLIRNVFHVKPGNARDFIEKFKNAAPHLKAAGLVKSTRILTDSVSDFWTVVIESEVEDLSAYLNMAKSIHATKEVSDALKGYVEMVNSGYREVFLIEHSNL